MSERGAKDKGGHACVDGKCSSHFPLLWFAEAKKKKEEAKDHHLKYVHDGRDPSDIKINNTVASLATTRPAESIGRDIYCILSVNMTAHQFHPVRRLFCAWHWFPMSASMSVYLRNRTKWPPITRPIDLRWWWKPVDKTSLPTHYAGAFVSSEK